MTLLTYIFRTTIKTFCNILQLQTQCTKKSSRIQCSCAVCQILHLTNAMCSCYHYLLPVSIPTTWLLPPQQIEAIDPLWIKTNYVWSVTNGDRRESEQRTTEMRKRARHGIILDYDAKQQPSIKSQMGKPQLSCILDIHYRIFHRN